MIEGISSSQHIYSPQYSASSRPAVNSLLNFDTEDQAIISAQAKILNELDRFNAGEGNEIELALATITGEIQVKAAVHVIKTKNEMMDSIMKIMD
ncbi:MAG: hypothetical protein A2Y25_10935 [Candidatus Melainabacteria bacterium GWF2_37_15]|nr:MAG: hypothetical protein A2Y25_10935 [Candidatus Melainabacteria bacterium GWF2_37_15]